MALPAYDIFKNDAAALVWVEAAQDLESAKKRIEELAHRCEAEFLIFDQYTQQVVASFPRRTRERLKRGSNGASRTVLGLVSGIEK